MVIFVSWPALAAPDGATDTISDGFGSAEPEAAGLPDAAADPAGFAEAATEAAAELAGLADAATEAGGALDAGAAAEPHPARRTNRNGTTHFIERHHRTTTSYLLPFPAREGAGGWVDHPS